MAIENTLSGETGGKAGTACFIGHWSLAWGQMEPLTQKLDDTVAALAKRGTTDFLTGAAGGFEQLAALAVLKAQEQNADIKLIIVSPCLNQDEGWGDADKQTYKRILGGADHIVYATEQPNTDGCKAEQYRLLTGRSGVCVAYMKHGHSGTSQTVRLASELGLTVINLAVNL